MDSEDIPWTVYISPGQCRYPLDSVYIPWTVKISPGPITHTVSQPVTMRTTHAHTQYVPQIDSLW